MRKSENEEELIDKAININNKWMTAFSVLTAEFSHIKISTSMQYHRFNAK